MLASVMRPLTGATLAAVLAMGAIAAASAEPVSAAKDPSCRVVNATRGGSDKSLAAAVKAARNGNKLLVKGTCKGATKIVRKRLIIEGRWSKKKGAPTLRSNGRNPVVTLEGSDATVSLKKLTVRGDPTVAVKSSGAGIKLNYADGGVLKLIDTKVKNLRTRGSGGCVANLGGKVELWGKTTLVGCIAAGGGGGGLYNDSGRAVLAGQTAIKRNRAKYGGGLFNDGGRAVIAGQTVIKRSRARNGGGVSNHGPLASVKLRSSATVTDNRATYHGGGLYILHGVGFVEDKAVISRNSADEQGGGIMVEGDETDLTLRGASRITGNSADFAGGGVRSKGRTMTMAGSSSITGNSASSGGGLYSAGWTTLVGVVCAPNPGANVTDNTTEDCLHG